MEGQALENADVSENGYVDEIDATYILEYLAGKRELNIPRYNIISENIKLKVYDENLNEITEGITWTSDNQSIATVENGQVTIKEDGQTIIKASNSDENTDEFYIEVSNESYDLHIAVDRNESDSNIKGDVNLDGCITSYDATAILLHTADTKHIEGQGLKNADVTEDGDVNASDAMYIFQYLNGKRFFTIPRYNVTRSDITLKVYDKDLNEITEGITWTSYNQNIATVENGNVTIKGNGQTIIIAKDSNRKIGRFYIEGNKLSDNNDLNIAIDQNVPDSKIKGDVNLDGYVTKYDAQAILCYTVDKKTLQGQALENADVTGDEKVDNTDATYIFEYLTGKRELEVPRYQIVSDDIKLKVYDKDLEEIKSEIIWTNGNSDIVDVDNGMVTIKENGHAVITARDSSDKADCLFIEVIKDINIPQLSYNVSSLKELKKDKNSAEWINNNVIYVYDYNLNKEGYEYQITEYTGSGSVTTGSWNDTAKGNSSFGDFYYIKLPGPSENVYYDGCYSIKVRKKGNVASESEVYYYKFDGTAPMIESISWTTTENSIIVNLQGKDELSGVKKYSIELSKANDNVWTPKTYEDSNTTCTFNDLTPNTFYYLNEVKVYDNAGNETELKESDYDRLKINSLDIYTKPEPPIVSEKTDGTKQLSKTSINIYEAEENQSLILYLIGNEKNSYKIDNGNYINSNDNIIYIDKIVGTHTLTVRSESSGGYSKEVTYQMKFIEPITASLDKTNMIIEKGKTQKITATLNPSDAEVLWSSSNTDIATVDQQGNVTAHERGTTVIILKNQDGKELATCNVKVIESITSVELNNYNATIEKGKTYTLKTIITPSDAVAVSTMWSSDNINIATVEGGIITGVEVGTANITVEVTDEAGNKFTKECIVNITEPSESNITIPIESITLNHESLELRKGNSSNLNLTINPNNANIKSITWTSDDKSIVTIEENGVNAVIKGLQEGKATVMVTVEDQDGNKISKTCIVTVKEANINKDENNDENNDDNNKDSKDKTIDSTQAKDNDKTTVNKVLPKTGINEMFGIVIAVSIISFIIFKKYRNYKDIK